MTAVGLPPTLSSEELKSLAAEHGLHQVGTRPPLLVYIRQVWKRRHFMVEMARGTTLGANEGSRLGVVWELLTPILWAALYLFTFGVLLKSARAGTHDFVGFLVTGLFIFRFISGCMGLGAKSILKNQNLITSLQFPRALVPMSATISEFFSLVPGLVVICLLALIYHEPIRWQNLLLVPAIGLMVVFTTGLALVFARLAAEIPDIANMLPFVTRLMMYCSGVFFSIEHFAGHGVMGKILTREPLAVYIELARSAVLSEIQVRPSAWLWAVFWAVAMFSVGLLTFWHAEAKYGRG